MWKFTDEDWRNREKYDQYIEIPVDMFVKTNCTDATWFIVHGDDKLHARLTVLQNIIQEIENKLDNRGIANALIPHEVKEPQVENEDLQGD